jgi:hypothetical protein
MTRRGLKAITWVVAPLIALLVVAFQLPPLPY